MTIGPILFWILMLLWLIFGIFYPYRTTWNTTGMPFVGGNLLLFVLLLIIGAHVFGIPRL
jgi:hypothetical protein